jgi:uncharacterized protein
MKFIKERCQSGRMGDTGNVVYPKGYRGFESLPLRSVINMKNMKKFTLSILPEKLGICHFDKKSPIPGWAEDVSFCSVTRTKDELSVVCPQDKIPGGVLAEKNWRAFKLEGADDIHSVGVISALAQPLAGAGISIFNISTYQTNYILVEEKNLTKAVEILGGFCEII